MTSHSIKRGARVRCAHKTRYGEAGRAAHSAEKPILRVRHLSFRPTFADTVFMTRFRIPALFPALLALMLLCACGSDVKPAPLAALAFKANDKEAKIFFYAEYDDPEEDRPSFEERFRLYIDKGYLQDISDSQYIETTLPPGKYIFSVDRIGWGGNARYHSLLRQEVAAGETVFIHERVRINKKPLLSRTDYDTGVEEVRKRTRTCLCDSGLF